MRATIVSGLHTYSSRVFSRCTATQSAMAAHDATTSRIHDAACTSGERTLRRRMSSLTARLETRRATRPGHLALLASGLVALVLLGWAAGTLIEHASGLDERIARAVTDHRVDWLTTVFKVVTWFGSSTF